MDPIQLPHDHGQDLGKMLATFPSLDDFQKLSTLLSLLGDASRLRLFWLLCHCEECVINISAIMGMSSPAVSHHLKQLRTSGLIVSRREGKEVYYQAAENQQVRLLHKLIEDLIAITCPGPAGSPKG